MSEYRVVIFVTIIFWLGILGLLGLGEFLC